MPNNSSNACKVDASFHLMEFHQRDVGVWDARVDAEMPASTPTRASKRCPRRLSLARVQEDARVGHVICALKDTCVGLLACIQEMPASATSYARLKRYARRPSPTSAKDGRVYIDACKDARVACYLCAKDGRVRGGYRDRDLVSLPPFFQPRSPPR